MKTRTKIKVIKKGTPGVVEKPVVIKIKPDSNDPSRLASRVSEWIDEFQQRRQLETNSAMKRFQKN